MKLFGNIVLALAGFIYLVPLQLINLDARRPSRDAGLFFATLIVLVPMWLLLLLALNISTGLGALDWTQRSRAMQHGLVSLVGLALLVVTALSLILRHETPSQVPYALKPFLHWSELVFPLVTILFVFWSLNPGLASRVPLAAYRWPFAVVAGLALLAGIGMLGQWVIHTQKKNWARVQRRIANDAGRDMRILAEVQQMETKKNFSRLLHFSNRFESPAIRELAISKAEAHPDFTEQLADVLQGYYADDGLMYLDVRSPADLKALAEPVRAAIVNQAKRARSGMEHRDRYHANQFDWDTRLILSVVDKFQGQGVDYVPAVQEFRDVLDMPKKKFTFNAQRPLDAWLAQNARKN